MYLTGVTYFGDAKLSMMSFHVPDRNTTSHLKNNQPLEKASVSSVSLSCLSRFIYASVFSKFYHLFSLLD